jgi:hypothetical protein
MNARHRLIVAAAMALAPIWGGASWASGPPSGGTISIEYKTADGGDNSSTTSFVNAAGEALATKGFTILDDPGHAAYIVELTLSRVEVGTGSAKVPRGSPVIPSGGGAGVGAGVTIPLSARETRLVPLQRFRLEMRIHKRGEDGVVWHGAAVTVRAAGTRKGTDDAVAADLSEAILRGFPAQSDDTATVP